MTDLGAINNISKSSFNQFSLIQGFWKFCCPETLWKSLQRQRWCKKIALLWHLRGNIVYSSFANMETILFYPIELVVSYSQLFWTWIFPNFWCKQILKLCWLLSGSEKFVFLNSHNIMYILVSFWKLFTPINRDQK